MFSRSLFFSFLISGLILASTIRMLKDALHVLMEGVPQGIDLVEAGQALAGVSGVRSVHDLHIWNISSGQIALSAHVDESVPNDRDLSAFLYVWGQFLDHRERIKPELREVFLQNLSKLDMDNLWRVFPLPALITNAPVEVFYDFYDVDA